MKILNRLKNQILVYDGAMGTMLQKKGLALDACPEEWIMSRPKDILAIHRSYAEAGADIVETNTFGGNRLSLKKYNLEKRCYEINYKAVKLARQACLSGRQARIYVAGSVGPLPQMVEPLGRISFSYAVDIFKEQIKALADAGPDIIILETFSDIKELKAAVIAAREVSILPIQAQLTYNENGTTITGTTPEAAVVILEGLGVDIIGANCSLGPKGLLYIMKRIAKQARHNTYLSVLPNAGLPDIRNGVTYYPATPERIGRYSRKFFDLGINLIGGCCGTTPVHIKAIVKRIKGKKPIPRRKRRFYLSAASRTNTVEFFPKDAPYIIGERINPSRRRLLKQELMAGKMSIVKQEARIQADAGAGLLDINVGAAEINEPSTMANVVDSVQEAVSLPLVLDSSNPLALEAGLQHCAGKPIVNSVDGEEEKLKTILFLVRKYGASVIGLTIDDEGIPMSAAKRISIAKRIIKEAIGAGIRKEDILIDFLTLAAGAQPGSPKVTLDAVKHSKRLRLQTILGVSNISFGLPNRQEINSTFMAMAAKRGLTSAIINPVGLKIKETLSVRRQLLGELPFIIQGKIKKSVSGSRKQKEISPAKKLYNAILTGDKENTADYMKQCLDNLMSPLAINQKILIPALEEVGLKFEHMEYFLPQLLLSAEAMQIAVAVMEKAMPKGYQKNQGRVLMATVKGDFHDIGKNIVCAVLKNHGYAVVDLGKSISSADIIKAVNNQRIDIIGLSALMTTSMRQMPLVIAELKKYNVNIPVMVGGAVVTSRYAKSIGADGYAGNAIGAAREVKRLFGR